jgi:hypothetical protein
VGVGHGKMSPKSILSDAGLEIPAIMPLDIGFQ